MFSEFLETLRAHTRMDQDVDTKTVIDLNRVERTMKTKSGTKLANKLSNHLRLLVTFLVIAWLFCSKRRILQPAGCQKHFIHPHNIYLTAREHLILGQRQALADQLLRSHHRSQSFAHQGSFLRPVSDRRNSQPQAQQPSTEIPVQSSPSPSPPPPPTATSSNENGKMLVCYYTTRQSGPFLSRGSREFVIPVDSQPPLDNLGQQQQQQQQQTGGGNNQFAPLFPYEPYFLAANGVPLAQAIQAQQVAYGDLGNANMAKNQQQQLIFKSLSSLGGMMPIVSANRVAAEPAATNSNSSNNGANDGKLKQQYLANQKTISQMLSLVPALDLTTQAHATMQTTSAGGSSTGRTTNKQMPVYSFIGDPETNNGLIVGQQLSSSSSIDVGGVTTAGPTTTTSTTSSTRNGNNRNGGFFPGKDTGVVNNGANQPAVGHQLDRNSMELMKQSLHQQLVFAPSLNRAFALGGISVANNADPADTKLPNYQAARPNSQLAYNQQQLRLKNGNLLEQQVFAGAVSSAPPVPLSPASSLHQYQQPQQTYSRGILPNANQVVFSSAGTLTTKKSNGAKPIGLLAEESPDGKAVLATGASSPDVASSPTSAMDSPPQPAQASVGLPAALVSSPLSTMFDVFGAASQYLMRFKPSSFISPSSFAFNSIPTDHQRLNHHHHKLHLQHQSNINQRLNGHHHVQNHALKSINSSLLDAIASAPSSSLPASPVPSSGSSVSSAASSLLSLPFSPSGILASIHKSSSSVASSNDRSSNGSHSMASGILSRLSSQNNQRREDVCGKTIHTPQRRIIGGEGARYGEFPYQVHIKIAKHQCGGALIDRQSIVTAAHCVYHFITRAPVSKLQIVIGAYDIEDEQYQELPPQYFKVNKVKLHPNFRFSASHPDRYDIAILKLDKPVKYTDNVMPVCLPSKDLKFESMVGTVTGFGKTDPSLSNRYGTRLLQKVDVPIIENNECERWHRTRGIDLKIFPEMMCAGYEDGLKDACVGDSGGPLVVKSAPGPDGSFRWTLAGITSAGFGCAQSRQPGIYHRVSHTVDWILENLD